MKQLYSNKDVKKKTTEKNQTETPLRKSKWEIRHSWIGMKIPVGKGWGVHTHAGIDGAET